jgi:hypothetical protein
LAARVFFAAVVARRLRPAIAERVVLDV